MITSKKYIIFCCDSVTLFFMANPFCSCSMTGVLLSCAVTILGNRRAMCNGEGLHVHLRMQMNAFSPDFSFRLVLAVQVPIPSLLLLFSLCHIINEGSPGKCRALQHCCCPFRLELPMEERQKEERSMFFAESEQ